MSILNLIYLRVKHFIIRGATKAPNAAPIGRAPIRPPTIEGLPALGPKYCTRVGVLMFDKKVREKPK